jgi:serine/threonine-protein kinase
MASGSDSGRFRETRPFRVLSSGKLVSHYKIIEKLGAGGMGVVYKAEDTRLKRNVALKFLPPELTRDGEAKERFVLEAQAASALDHPNICNIHEIDETDDGQLFIAMACYDGETLRRKLKQGPLGMEEALDITIQVAHGLLKAHEKGIVHRDVKPANIMITSDGVVKIMDFGLAKLAGQTGLTKAGTTVGTVAYMSPEQARGREIDHGADIWSLGIVLYEMITGELPFKGEADQAVIYSILNEEPIPAANMRAGVPSELETNINKALAKNPELRYETVRDFLADLTKARGALEGDVSKRFSGRKTKPSVAVLPFTDMSPQQDQEYFCDGMAEELISALTNLEGLQVASRTSAFQFKGKAYSICEIGRRLNVQNVLEGSVRKAGNRLRITAELVSIADGYHLWSEKYDRELEDIFAIQDEISLAIVDKLKPKLLAGEKAKLVKRFTDSQEAYNLYLKGRYFWNRRYEVGMQRGLVCFQQAIDIDPLYALAYTGIADSNNFLGLYGLLRPLEAYPRAKEAAEKALEIDDTIAEVHASLGWIRMYFNWDWSAAEKEFRRAIELNPNYATAHEWYSMLLAAMGRYDEAITEIKRAQELDPLSLIVNAMVGCNYYFARQFDRAIEQLQKTLELDPNFSMTLLFLGAAYAGKAMWKDAISALQKLAYLSEGRPFAAAFLGSVQAMSGQREEALKTLGQLDKVSAKVYFSPWHRALIHMGLGDKDRAFECLEKAYLERESFFAFLNELPLIDSLRSDPRFATLVKKTGLGE